jgi:hypothetical protein
VHEDLVDVVASDLAVTALAERAPLHAEDADDSVVRLLQAWAADIDAHPVPVSDADDADDAALLATATHTRRRPRGAAARSVVAMTIALTLSSSGIAAAVQGNPLAPINYVVDKFGHLGAQHDRSSPVDLLGAPNLPPTEAGRGTSRDRAESAQRPSRGDSGQRPQRDDPSHSDGAGSGSGPTVEAHEVRASHGTGDASRQRPQHSEHRRHRHLVVRPAHHRPPPVQSPKPNGGETPPNRPEPPSGEGVPTLPKPATSESPIPPPVEPMTPAPERAPVR